MTNKNDHLLVNTGRNVFGLDKTCINLKYIINMTKTALPTAKSTSQILIEKRESLIEGIKQNWARINQYNVFKNGSKQLFDIAAVYAEIKKFEADLIKTKVYIQAINMGLTSPSKIPDNCVYPTIFSLQQLKERITKIERIPTKKEDGESVTFTRQFIEKELVILNEQKALAQKELDEYNNEVKFQIE